MAWIESHQALGNHPKLLKMSRAMGWSKADTLGRLHLFWHWCLDYATDGQLDKHGMNVVADVFEIPELEREKFVRALRESEFVDFEPELRVHDWWDYSGKFLQIRYKHKPAIWKNIKRLYGLRIERTKNRQRTDKDGLKNIKPNQPTVTNLDLTNQPKPTSLKTGGEDKPSPPPAKSEATWDAYSSAYEKRWNTKPVRHAKVNSLLCQVVDALGADTAPLVADFYLSHNEYLYVRARHPPNLLVRDVDSLHTQWVTGIKATQSEAKSAGQQDDAREQVKRVEAMLKKGPL